MKKYIGKTWVSLNVTLKNGKHLHVSFAAQTSGGSVYYTDDEDVQKALEAHPKYGRLFTADLTEVDLPQADVVKKNPVLDGMDGDGAAEVKKVHVSDLDEAKNYLSEKFGISRTKLSKKELIMKAAAQNGIELVIGE